MNIDYQKGSNPLAPTKVAESLKSVIDSLKPKEVKFGSFKNGGHYVAIVSKNNERRTFSISKALDASLNGVVTFGAVLMNPVYVRRQHELVMDEKGDAKKNSRGFNIPLIINGKPAWKYELDDAGEPTSKIALSYFIGNHAETDEQTVDYAAELEAITK